MRKTKSGKHKKNDFSSHLGAAETEMKPAFNLAAPFATRVLGCRSF
jgi:hypothetical protein